MEVDGRVSGRMPAALIRPTALAMVLASNLPAAAMNTTAQGRPHVDAHVEHGETVIEANPRGAPRAAHCRDKLMHALPRLAYTAYERTCVSRAERGVCGSQRFW